jgi:hypothetical protein
MPFQDGLHPGARLLQYGFYQGITGSGWTRQPESALPTKRQPHPLCTRMASDGDGLWAEPRDQQDPAAGLLFQRSDLRRIRLPLLKGRVQP